MSVKSDNVDFLESDKLLKAAEIKVWKSLNDHTLLVDGEIIVGSVVIAYEHGEGDKRMQVEKLRKLSAALNALANEYEAHPLSA